MGRRTAKANRGVETLSFGRTARRVATAGASDEPAAVPTAALPDAGRVFAPPGSGVAPVARARITVVTVPYIFGWEIYMVSPDMSTVRGIVHQKDIVIERTSIRGSDRHQHDQSFGCHEWFLIHARA